MRRLLPLLALVALAVSATATGAPTRSPHGNPSECASCHADRAGTGFVGGSDTAACRSCHAEEPHQVGIAPVTARVPAQFPLVDGKLACQSCHDEPACDGKELSDDNPQFFRGGPYAKLGQLCANCHEETALDRYDPHRAMREATASNRDEACLYCHETLPDPATPREALRLPGADTCQGCHFETSHAGSGEHLVKLSATQAKSARAAGLPLGHDDTATCATCHDPHPPGSTPAADRRLGWKEQRVVSTAWERDVLRPSVAERAGEGTEPLLHGHDMLRLSLADGSLCRACHGHGPGSGP